MPDLPSHLRARAGIYRALMRAPFAQTQAEVDDTEMWVIATALGAGEEPADEPDGMQTPEEFDLEAEEFNRQRVLAAQGLGPPPQAPSRGDVVPDAMMEAFLRQKAERAASAGDTG